MAPAKEEKKAEGENKEEEKDSGKKDEKKVKPPKTLYVSSPYPYTVVIDDRNATCTPC